MTFVIFGIIVINIVVVAVIIIIIIVWLRVLGADYQECLFLVALY